MEGTLREAGRAAGQPRGWGWPAWRRVVSAVVAVAGLVGIVGSGTETGDPPQITAAPQATAVDDGQSATFTVAASGDGLRYQWQRNGNAVTGATAASYTLAPATLADDGARFAVVVSNEGGSVTSAAATLTVRPVAPAVVTAPAAATAYEGRTARFSVVASGSAPLAYQWLRAGLEIAGATAASYTTPVLAAGDNGAVFSVRISNAAGSVTTAGAALTVSPPPPAPVIDSPPQAASVVAGQTAQFSVGASGTAPLSYQWRRNGSPIAGATAASHTTAATTLADSGALYSVVVSNDGGSTESAAVALTVTAAPVLPGQARLTFGVGHVVAVRADGSVIAWGANTTGQLGAGAAIAGSNARQVPTTAQAVGAGTYESLALGSDGLVRGWGRKFAGGTILGGDAATAGTDVPTPATGGWPGGVTQLVTGGGNRFALVLRSDGTVWQLPGTATAIAGGLNQAARQVGGLPAIARLGAGVNGDASAIDASGNLWRIVFSALPGGSWGAVVSAVSGVTGATASACGGAGCLVLDGAGRVVAFNPAGTAAPAPVAGLPTVKQIAVTGTGFLALAVDGQLWRWNAGATPALVAGLANIVEVAGGLQTVLVRLADGSVWGYGANDFGELGLGAPTSSATPIQVPGINLN